MTTEPLTTSLSFEQALDELRRPQGVICFQLNGRYVLSCDPSNDHAVQRINTLKQRQPGRPLAMIFAHLDAALRSSIHSPLFHLLPTFAPLLTVSVASPPGVSRFAHQGIGMIGVGLADQGVARGLLEAWGGPLLVSSANPTGQPSPRSYEQVRAYGFDVPLLQSPHANMSEVDVPHVTVVSLKSSKVHVLSQGVVTQEQLDEEWARLRAHGVV